MTSKILTNILFSLFIFFFFATAHGADYAAYLDSINDSNATGYVSLSISGGVIAGYAEGSGLESDILASDCTADNCMGIHVHEGMSCVDADSQGGHYYYTDEDPWATSVYNHTTTSGKTDPTYAFVNVNIGLDTDDLRKRAFIMHDFSGGRVACGLLVLLPTK